METHLSAALKLTPDDREDDVEDGAGHRPTWPLHLILTEEALSLDRARTLVDLRYRWRAGAAESGAAAAAAASPWRRARFSLRDRRYRRLVDSLRTPVDAGADARGTSGEPFDVAAEFALFTTVFVPRAAHGDDTVVVRAYVSRERVHALGTPVAPRLSVLPYDNSVGERVPACIFPVAGRPRFATCVDRPRRQERWRVTGDDDDGADEGREYEEWVFFWRELVAGRPRDSAPAPGAAGPGAAPPPPSASAPSSRRPAAEDGGGESTRVRRGSAAAAAAAAAAAEDDRDVLALLESEDEGRHEDFFDIDPTNRRLTRDMDRWLRAFVRDEGRAFRQGPLEEPSQIRGWKVTDRRGGFVRYPEVTEKRRAPPKPFSERWFGAENDVHAAWVWDVPRRRRVVSVWYRAEAREEDAPPEQELDAVRRRTAILGATVMWQARLREVARRVMRELSRAVSRAGGRLRQRLACVVAEDVDWDACAQFLWLSRDVWVASLTRRSCIIKAARRSARRGGAEDGSEDDEEPAWPAPPFALRRCWADVIDCGGARVCAGVEIAVWRDADDLVHVWGEVEEDAPLPAAPDLARHAGEGRRGAGSGRLGPADVTPRIWEDGERVVCQCVLLAFPRLTRVWWLLPGGFAAELRLDSLATTLRVS